MRLEIKPTRLYTFNSTAILNHLTEMGESKNNEAFHIFFFIEPLGKNRTLNQSETWSDKCVLIVALMCKKNRAIHARIKNWRLKKVPKMSGV